MLTSILEPTHLILIAGIALLVLGPNRLPAAARALGDSVREIRHGFDAAAVTDDQPVDDAVSL